MCIYIYMMYLYTVSVPFKLEKLCAASTSPEDIPANATCERTRYLKRHWLWGHGGKCTSLTWQTWKALPFSCHETRDWFERFFFVARFKTVLRVQILQRGHEKFQILQDMFVFQAVGSTPTYRIRSVRTMKIWVRRCHWTPPIGDLRFFRHPLLSRSPPKIYIFGTVDLAAARATQLKLLRTHPASFGPFPLPPPNFSALLLFCFFDANIWWN